MGHDTHYRILNAEYKSSFLKNRFTLVELLVVIAIIGILASLLLPALKKASAQASSLLCLNNQKQLGTLFFTYQNDWNGWAPRGCSYETYPIDSLNWSYVFREELGLPKNSSSDLFFCGARDPISGRTTDYAYNSSYSWIYHDQVRRKAGSIRNPSHILLFTDAARSSWAQFFVSGIGLTWTIPSGASSYYVMWIGSKVGTPHDPGLRTNASFMDGHAKVSDVQILTDSATEAYEPEGVGGTVASSEDSNSEILNKTNCLEY